MFTGNKKGTAAFVHQCPFLYGYIAGLTLVPSDRPFVNSLGEKTAHRDFRQCIVGQAFFL